MAQGIPLDRKPTSALAYPPGFERAPVGRLGHDRMPPDHGNLAASLRKYPRQKTKFASVFNTDTSVQPY
jgi:hypothetical protein